MYSVSQSAIIQRVRRSLQKRGLVLRKSRKWNSDLRNYYVLDVYRNTVVAAYDSIGDLANEEGVLESHETIESGSKAVASFKLR